MTGEEFRQKVGGVVKTVEGQFALERKSEFQHVAKTLKVLGRANPLDKHILTTGLKEIGVSRDASVSTVKSTGVER